ncbi:hypothetical protein ACB092_08G109800 [Castanea dentata]
MVCLHYVDLSFCLGLMYCGFTCGALSKARLILSRDNYKLPTHGFIFDTLPTCASLHFYSITHLPFRRCSPKTNQTLPNFQHFKLVIGLKSNKSIIPRRDRFLIALCFTKLSLSLSPLVGF